MKALYSILLLVLLAFNHGMAQESPIDCNAPQSQYEKDLCAFKEEEIADKELNRIYKYTLTQLSQQEQALLKTAQKSWLTFRDNHCKIYGQMYYGSSGMMMMLSVCRKELILHRIEELRVLSER